MMVDQMRLEALVTVLTCLSSSSDYFTKPSILNEITQSPTEQQCKTHFYQYEDKIAQLTKRISALQTEINSLKSVHEVHILPQPKQAFNAQCELQQRQIGRLKFNTLLCDIKEHGDGWTMVAHRFDRSVDFDKTWNEWKYGFGSLDGEFYLGLEKIQTMTSEKRHEFLIIFEYPRNVKRYGHYDDIQIADESEDYKLKLMGKFEGDAKETFRIGVGYKFSTPDRNNDQCPKDYKCPYIGGLTWYSLGRWYCCYQAGLSFHTVPQEGVPIDIKWFLRAKRD